MSDTGVYKPLDPNERDLEEFIERHGSGGEPPLLVKRLREQGFNDKQIGIFVRTIEYTCSHCWDAEVPAWYVG